MNCNKLATLIALGNPTKIASPEDPARDYLFSTGMNVTLVVTPGSSVDTYAKANELATKTQAEYEADLNDPLVSDWT